MIQEELKRLKCDINLKSEFTPKEAMFLYRCVRLILVAVPTQEYRLKFLAANIKHDRGESNTQLYRKIVSGWDRVNREEDLTLTINLYKRSMKRTTYAMTSMTSGNITINSSYLAFCMNKANGEINMARTLLHEYVHSIGYKHPWWPKSWYRKSVPHTAGDVLGAVLEFHILLGQPLTPIQGYKNGTV